MTEDILKVMCERFGENAVVSDVEPSAIVTSLRAFLKTE